MFEKLFLFLLVTLLFLSCSSTNFKKFKKLSKPHKNWTILHPFKAKKALIISKEAKRVSDSIRKTNLLDGDPAGGQVDAFRHGYWMARLHQEIGENAARSLGRAHEKDNYLTFTKRKLEDGVVPDEISSTMDLFNNEIGLTLTKKNRKITKKRLIYRVVNEILKGKMRIIKKDKNGAFLTCTGELIHKKSLKGKWKNNKCLVNSKHTNLN